MILALDCLAVAFAALLFFNTWVALSDIDSMCGNDSNITSVDILRLERNVHELEATLTKLRATNV